MDGNPLGTGEGWAINVRRVLRSFVVIDGLEIIPVSLIAEDSDKCESTVVAVAVAVSAASPAG